METINFADIGEGITEGHVLKLLYKDGDKVEQDNPIAEIETDKAVVSIPTPVDGFIRYNIKIGDTIKVGDEIAVIGSTDEISNKTGNSGTVTNNNVTEQNKTKVDTVIDKVPAVVNNSNDANTNNSVMATPAVKRLALNLNINIRDVNGTGPHGKILEEDVRKFADSLKGKSVSNSNQESTKVTAPATAPTTSNSVKSDILSTNKIESNNSTRRVPLSFLRKAIAKNMSVSSSIPTASHMDLIDSDELYNLLNKTKDYVQKNFDVKLTYLPFMIKATVQTLKNNPYFNASFDPDTNEVILKDYYNIGLGAETKDGLKIIVIKDADKKSVVEIAKDLINLREKLYNNTITISEMKGNSFTITNIGSLGGGFMGMPLINPPDVAILSFGIIKDTPVVKNGEVVPGKVMEFTLTFDHRVVDGADAAKFGNELKRYLENPSLLTLF